MDFSFQRNSQKWFFKKMIKFLNTFFSNKLSKKNEVFRINI